jgi:Tfp pilus assembly protein PilF
VKLVPKEPAGWANRGLWHLRNNRPNEANHDLERAERLAPDNGHIALLRGLLAENQGKLDDAEKYFRAALEREPSNAEARYKLSQIVAKQGGEEADAREQELLEEILASDPNNLFVLLKRLTVAVRRNDKKAKRETMAQLTKLAPNWSGPGAADARKHLVEVVAPAVAGPPIPKSFVALGQLENLVRPEPAYKRSRQALDPPGAQAGTSFQKFLRLAPVRPTPAPPDRELTFQAEPLPGANRQGSALVPVWLTGQGTPVVFVANGKEARQAGSKAPALLFPGGAAATPPSPDGLLALDWNNDQRNDVLLAGAGGLRFYQQGPGGGFADVTDKIKIEPDAKLPKDVLRDDYYGAWVADVDVDGDLDIILAPRAGPPILLRNNRDGSFKALPIFPGVKDVRAFVWADLDNDGAPDAALLDEAGTLHVFFNERLGEFRKGPAVPGTFRALAVADVNDDGVFDLVALRSDGALLRISDKDKRQGWDVGELGNWAALPKAGPVRLLIGDLDNNGALDVVASAPSGAMIWLANEKGALEPLAAQEGGVTALVDVNGDGRLDLLALDEQGQAVQRINRGSKAYHWQSIRPRGDITERGGDNRINSFGIGGELEVRTGTLVVKQPITGPVVHVGLGERQRASVVRVVWPNGQLQVEFELGIDAAVLAPQRLKTSCPFLFTWDGKQMVFVSDFLWSTPLGMHINAQAPTGFAQTTDWVRIRGDQLVPRDGQYDIRVNANLWETHYIDHLALIVVDHPANTEAFVDERFFLTPTKPRVYLMKTPRPVARAWDHKGAEVTDIVRAIDGNYLDRAGRGRFQGVTRDHWVEVDLGEGAPKTGPVYLLAYGWVHPTDSSINVAIEQGQHEAPRGLVLEVPDGKGGWKVALDKLGFPAGKNKTIVIRLDGIDGPGVTRRFRLRTNMEIYWDALHYAEEVDVGQCRQQVLAPTKAELRFRGIVEITQANISSPELPHYDRLLWRRQHWRDLIGHYTRFGDVRELLAKVDDRYVIMNAGDELLFNFAAPPAPAEGWKRTFVWVSDGWVKDGDLNTRFGKTVLPLPYHKMKSYDTPPGQLADDPVYQSFPRDWEVYHTRYVSPDLFERGLRSFRRP